MASSSEDRCIERSKALLAVGDVSAAAAHLQKFIDSRPKSIQAARVLASIYVEVNDLSSAATVLSNAVAQSPNDLTLLRELARVHHSGWNLAPLAQAARAVLALDASDEVATAQLAVALAGSDHLDEAWALFQTALRDFPRSTHIRQAYAETLQHFGRLDEAIEVLNQNAKLDPGFLPTWLLLAEVYRNQGNPDGAIAALQRALAVQPGHAVTTNNLAQAFADRGEPAQSVALLHRLIVPGLPAKMHSELLFSMQFDPGISEAHLAGEEARFQQLHGESLRHTWQPFDLAPPQGRRLRIGYLSADFRMHPIGRMILPILRAHDSDAFEVFCYSNSQKVDLITDATRAVVPNWREIHGLTDADAARLIREDRIDLLVDLSLHTYGNRLALIARKPAPTIVTWLGYPGRTGLHAVDFRISDRFLESVPVPASGGATHERPLILPHSFWCYEHLDKPMISVPSVNPLPALSGGHVTFGSLNKAWKHNNHSLSLFGHVLKTVPSSRLVLSGPPGQFRTRALDILAQASGDPAVGARVSFVHGLSPEAYFAAYHRIDIALDPIPYHGHVTTLDAALMGVPTLSVSIPRTVGHAGASILSALTLPEWTTPVAPDLLVNVRRLSADLPSLALLRSQLRDRLYHSPLTANADFTRNIESLYLQAVSRMS